MWCHLQERQLQAQMRANNQCKSDLQVMLGEMVGDAVAEVGEKRAGSAARPSAKKKTKKKAPKPRTVSQIRRSMTKIVNTSLEMACVLSMMDFVNVKGAVAELTEKAYGDGTSIHTLRKDKNYDTWLRKKHDIAHTALRSETGTQYVKERKELAKAQDESWPILQTHRSAEHSVTDFSAGEEDESHSGSESEEEEVKDLFDDDDDD